MSKRSTLEIERLIEQNLSLVKFVVKKYFTLNNNDFDDLVALGNIGLLKAAQTFDDSKNIKFSVYAIPCIKNEINMHLRKKSFYNYISLTTPISADPEGHVLMLSDCISDSSSNFSKNFENQEEFAKFISIVLNVLHTKEKFVILYTLAGINQYIIGEILDINQPYVSRLISWAREKLTFHLKSERHFDEIFSVKHESNNLYKMTFSSDDVENFDEIFANFSQNSNFIKNLSGFKIVLSKNTFTVFFIAEQDVFLYLAYLMQKIDGYIISENTLMDLICQVKPKRESISTTVGAEILEYILSLNCFSVAQVKEHFPNASATDINNTIHRAKLKNLIKTISRGNYEVVPNKEDVSPTN